MELVFTYAGNPSSDLQAVLPREGCLTSLCRLNFFSLGQDSTRRGLWLPSSLYSGIFWIPGKEAARGTGDRATETHCGFWASKAPPGTNDLVVPSGSCR